MEILQALAQLTQDAEPGKVYQVLKGKRTATTLFSAYRYQLVGFFNSFPTLDKKRWLAVWQSVKRDDAGGELLASFQTVQRYRQGFIPVPLHVERRVTLRLFFQTLSYLRVGEHRFVPVTQHIAAQRLVKQYLQALRRAGYTDAAALSRAIHRELVAVLSTWDTATASALVATFAGHGVTAWTAEQVLPVQGEPAEWPALYQEALWDRFEAALDDTRTPLLARFRRGISETFPAWNDSVERTRRRLVAGDTLSAIAHERRLKESTIADHAMELMLHDPALLKQQVAQLTRRQPLPLTDTPPETFRAFQDTYGELPFWLYRYWQVLNLRREWAHGDE